MSEVTVVKSSENSAIPNGTRGKCFAPGFGTFEVVVLASKRECLGWSYLLTNETGSALFQAYDHITNFYSNNVIEYGSDWGQSERIEDAMISLGFK